MRVKVALRCLLCLGSELGRERIPLGGKYKRIVRLERRTPVTEEEQQIR